MFCLDKTENGVMDGLRSEKEDRSWVQMNYLEAIINFFGLGINPKLAYQAKSGKVEDLPILIEFESVNFRLNKGDLLEGNKCLFEKANPLHINDPMGRNLLSRS